METSKGYIKGKYNPIFLTKKEICRFVLLYNVEGYLGERCWIDKYFLEIMGQRIISRIRVPGPGVLYP